MCFIHVYVNNKLWHWFFLFQGKWYCVPPVLLVRQPLWANTLMIRWDSFITSCFSRIFYHVDCRFIWSQLIKNIKSLMLFFPLSSGPTVTKNFKSLNSTLNSNPVKDLHVPHEFEVKTQTWRWVLTWGKLLKVGPVCLISGCSFSIYIHNLFVNWQYHIQC